MTPKEKAKELVDRFWNLDMIDDEGYTFWISKQNSKQCALICVDEIIEANPTVIFEEIIDGVGYQLTRDGNLKYWQEVKQEIQKL